MSTAADSAHPTVGPRPSLALYFGSGRVEDLPVYRQVVLRPEAYSPAELAELHHRGTTTLAHLSLTEDGGPPAPWQCACRSRERGCAQVHLDHPGWAEHLRSYAAGAFEAGFSGLFLDGLTAEWIGRRELPLLLGLAEALRTLSGSAPLLVNGGFALLPRLAELVDGMLFESFTARAVDGGYAAWPADVLAAHDRLAERLLGFPVQPHALDYADDEPLAALSRQRAHRFGMSSFVTDHALTRLPGAPASPSTSAALP
jgi:hypothetical protein